MKLRTRLLSVVASIVAVVIVCGGAAWHWLLHTHSGAVWILAQAETRTEGAFTSRSLDGDLSGGLSLQDVSYSADGVDVRAEKAAVMIDIDLLPLSVEVVSARIEGARVAISDTPNSQKESTDIAETLRRLRLPVRVGVSGLIVDGLAFESPGFSYTITLLELAAQWHDSILIERLRADGEDIHVEADGSFDLVNNLEYRANVTARLDPGMTGRPEPVEIEIRSEGSPDRLGLHIEAPDFAAAADGEIRSMFEQPVWDINASVQHYLWPLEDDEEFVELRGLTVRSTGSLSGYSVSASGDIHVPGTRWLSVGVEGEGNRSSFTAAMLRAEGADLDMSGTARVAWAAERVLETSLTIVRIDPQFLMPAWPDEYPLRGTVNAMLDENRLLISDSQLFVPRTGAEVYLDAEVDRDSGSVLGALRWENLRWPLDGETFDIKSDEADVRVDGTLDAWAVDGTIRIGARDVAEGTFRIDGGGNRDAAQVRILEARILGGTIEGELEYSWRGAKPWRGAIDVATIETGSLVPEWPGQLTGRIEANGTIEPLAVSAEFTEIDGTLRGNSLHANGGFSLVDKTLVIDDLHAMHGESTFRADGGLDETSGLVFEVSIADAGYYVADLSGDLNTSGVIRTTPGQQFLSIVLDAEELQYRDVVLEKLRIDDVRTPDQVAGLHLQAASVRVGNREFSELTAQLAATTDRQSIVVSGAYLDSGMSISLEGALEDWNDPLGAGWRGVIKTFEVAPDDEHLAKLLSPAELFISSEQVDIAELCIGPDTDANFCASGNWAATGVYAASARFNNVPVDLLDYLVDTGLTFDQVINGEIQWSFHPATGPTGFGRLSATPGRIASIDSPTLTLPTGQGVLNFKVADNKLLSGTLGLPLPGNGEINGNFRLHDLDHIEDSGISGGIVAVVSEIAILSPLIPVIDAASGRLHVDINLTGSVGAPLLRGNLTIDEGSVVFDPLGLLLEDLTLAARLTENYHIDLDGDFRSGDGRGTVTAAADYRNIEDPDLRVGFKGERLALVNVEDVSVVANPDFEIALSSGTLSVDGSLHIAEALVTPVSLPVSQVHESADVVVVVGELPDLPETKRVDGLRYSGSLEVSLSDNVVVDLAVARASVEGNVIFEWRGESMPFANGRYDINGTIAAFGQVLDITSGSVRFPNVPADNPVVRIRAEREIYGNTQVKRAGVLVDGPLRRPSVDPYTQPATTEERALTLLVTGSDFDYEQGVGAIDFGTYIAPRVFVSYGIGVFERDNIVSARFDFTKGFGIKASSGDKETGIDLNYRIEN